MSRSNFQQKFLNLYLDLCNCLKIGQSQVNCAIACKKSIIILKSGLWLALATILLHVKNDRSPFKKSDTLKDS